MERRISLVTLGVSDLVVSREFYRRLGWEPVLDVEETVFFQLGPMVLSLWSRRSLAEDAGVVDRGGWGGFALAQNVGSVAEVEAVIAEATAAGATITRPPGPTTWGGYTGIFCDPDGHPWEVAHNPGFNLGEDGSLTIPV